MSSLPRAVLDVLRCPLCSGPLSVESRSLRCAAGHTFDIAKQGYVNLLHAGVPAGTADTPAMVTARAEFLGAGHYTPLADAIVRACQGHLSTDGPELVVDAGAGTGYYLAQALDALPDATGLALDLSKYALRRAAKAHPRIGAAAWNVWHPLPLASGCADAIINVFAPRNGADFRRVLRSDGVLVVVTPTAEHLAELAEFTTMLDVDPDKDRRLTATLSDHFVLGSTEDVRFPLRLGPDTVRALLGMGPNAHHGDHGTPGELPPIVAVTASCTVAVYRPRRS